MLEHCIQVSRVNSGELLSCIHGRSNERIRIFNIAGEIQISTAHLRQNRNNHREKKKEFSVYRNCQNIFVQGRYLTHSIIEGHQKLPKTLDILRREFLIVHAY